MSREQSRQQAERMRQAILAKTMATAGKPRDKKTPPKLADNLEVQPRRRRVVPRLPDGARFEAHYGADTQEWIGKLIVPHLPSSVPAVFIAHRHGVFAVLEDLDDQYREWLKQQPVSPTHSEEKAREAE